MNQINNFISRLNNNQNIGFSLIRIFLGIALFVRGFVLASDPDAIFEIVSEDSLHMWYSYITIVHLLGGLCLTIGILSRVAAFFQIPILIGAVSISEKGLMMGGQSLELATLVLFLLVVYFIFGPGSVALSSYLNRKKTENNFESPKTATIT